MLLAVIAKMDREGVDTDIEKLAELGNFFKSHVEYMLDNLLEEGLIVIDDEKKASTKSSEAGHRGDGNAPSTSRDEESPRGTAGGLTMATTTVTIKLPRGKRLVEVHDFSVTQKGLSLLEEKKKELAKLSVAMQRLYNTKNRDELYKAIFWNREWIAFMLYTGVLTTDYLKAMMKFLGLDLYRLSMTEMQETLDGLGIDPLLLSAGLFLVHPILAIASYIISMVTMNKLEEKWKQDKKKAPGMKSTPDGDIYIPEID
jgi:hypothetical protein